MARISLKLKVYALLSVLNYLIMASLLSASVDGIQWIWAICFLELIRDFLTLHLRRNLKLKSSIIMFSKLLLTCPSSPSMQYPTSKQKTLLGFSSFSLPTQLPSLRTLTKKIVKRLSRPPGRPLSLAELKKPPNLDKDSCFKAARLLVSN